MRIGNNDKNMWEEINVLAVDQKHEYDEHWPKQPDCLTTNEERNTVVHIE